MKYVVMYWTPATRDDKQTGWVVIYDTEVEAEAAMYRLIVNGYDQDRMYMYGSKEHNLVGQKRE